MALLLAGCTVHQVPVRPAPAPPPGFAPAPVNSPDRPPEASVTPVPALVARDPAFAPLMRAGLEANPDLALAAANLDLARARLEGARAAARPSVDGNFRAATRRTAIQSLAIDLPPGIRFDTVQTQFTPEIGVGWEVDLWGRLRAARRAETERLAAATADAAAVRLLVEAEIALALVRVRAADEQAAAARDALAARQGLLRIAVARAEAGLVTRLDAETIGADVAAAEARLAAIAAARNAAIAALIPLTGLPQPRIEVLLATLVPLVPLADWTVPDVPSDLLTRRPDIAAADARLRAADQDVAFAVASRYPSLTLSAALGLLATPAGAFVLSDALTGLVAGTLSGPIFDFGRNAAEVAAANAAVAGSIAAYSGTVLSAFAEVAEAQGSAAAARNRAAALATASRRQARARTLAEAQYRGGLVSGIDLAESDRRLADARALEIEASAEALEAAIRLERASGTALGASVGSP
jgi:multidrug efflux system outer membrane protein